MLFEKAVMNSRVSYEEMMTLLSAVEAIINNRPLTFVRNESPLTPDHLYCRTFDFSAIDKNTEPTDIDIGAGVSM